MSERQFQSFLDANEETSDAYLRVAEEIYDRAEEGGKVFWDEQKQQVKRLGAVPYMSMQALGEGLMFTEDATRFALETLYEGKYGEKLDIEYSPVYKAGEALLKRAMDYYAESRPDMQVGTAKNFLTQIIIPGWGRKVDSVFSKEFRKAAMNPGGKTGATAEAIESGALGAGSHQYPFAHHSNIDRAVESVTAGPGYRGDQTYLARVDVMDRIAEMTEGGIYTSRQGIDPIILRLTGRHVPVTVEEIAGVAGRISETHIGPKGGQDVLPMHLSTGLQARVRNAEGYAQSDYMESMAGRGAVSDTDSLGSYRRPEHKNIVIGENFTDPLRTLAHESGHGIMQIRGEMSDLAFYRGIQLVEPNEYPRIMGELRDNMLKERGSVTLGSAWGQREQEQLAEGWKVLLLRPEEATERMPSFIEAMIRATKEDPRLGEVIQFERSAEQTIFDFAGAQRYTKSVNANRNFLKGMSVATKVKPSFIHFASNDVYKVVKNAMAKGEMGDESMEALARLYEYDWETLKAFSKSIDVPFDDLWVTVKHADELVASGMGKAEAFTTNTNELRKKVWMFQRAQSAMETLAKGSERRSAVQEDIWKMISGDPDLKEQMANFMLSVDPKLKIEDARTQIYEYLGMWNQ